MFAKGPQPGYSPKTAFLKLMPSAVCRKKYAICDLVGFVIYLTKEDADNDINGFTSAGSAVLAWDKAYGKFLTIKSEEEDKQ